MSPQPEEASATRLRVMLDDKLSHWQRKQLRVEPLSRSAAEASIRRAYECCGFAAPLIVWGQSPFEIEALRQRAFTRRTSHPGAPVRYMLFDQPLMRALSSFRAAFTAKAMSLARPTDDRARRRLAMNAAEDWVEPRASAISRRPGIATRRLWNSLLGTPSGEEFGAVRWAPCDMRDVLGFCEFGRDVLGEQSCNPQLDIILDAADQTSWVLPYEKVCWLSERWTKFATDDEGRLHDANGPAIAFLDDTKVYFWKNVEMPPWAIETPEKISCRRISHARSPVVRRCLIEIMTPERFIASGQPRILARDQTGILWGKQWANDMWKAVEVVDGTARDDGSRATYILQVPGHVQTALEGVAWTYGLLPQRYLRLTQRT
jgi:uncharacterized protein DUF6745